MAYELHLKTTDWDFDSPMTYLSLEAFRAAVESIEGDDGEIYSW